RSASVRAGIPGRPPEPRRGGGASPPDVTLVAAPPGETVAPGAHVLRGGDAVQRRMPLRGKTGLDRCQARVLGRTTSGTERTARPTARAASDLRLPLVPGRAPPPDAAVAPRAHLVRAEPVVSGLVPLDGEIRPTLGERPEAARHPPSHGRSGPRGRDGSLHHPGVRVAVGHP